MKSSLIDFFLESEHSSTTQALDNPKIVSLLKPNGSQEVHLDERLEL
jgi:hypothetical protein